MSLSASLYAVLAAPLVGSFLGVLVTRLPLREPVLWARSACQACGCRLAPRDLVPLVSWALLRGKCRSCGAKIGLFYPAIELAAIAVALWAAAVADGPLLLWATCALGWGLLALFVIDLRHHLLPDALTAPLAALGLLVTGLIDRAAVLSHLLGVVLGYGAFVSIAWAYRRMRGRDGLGRGDAKLLGAAGAWTSWAGLPSVVLIAAAVGLAVALATRARGGRLAADTRIAFGPGLCVGIWLVWLYGPLG
jgi:leader peptidase (prepilin peptidase) / N-methyltransferase